MKVISLYGSSNTGKTSTLRLVIDMLIMDGAKIVKIDPVNFNFQQMSADVDVRCCLETTFGKKVCVTTSGDNDYQQMENKKFVFNCRDVDAWITASRNYGGSVKAIWSATPFVVSEVFKVAKTRCFHIFKELGIGQYNWGMIEDKLTVKNDYEVCNQHDAKRIVRFLKKII